MTEWLALHPGWAVFGVCCVQPLIMIGLGYAAGRWSNLYRVRIVPRDGEP